MNSRNSRQGHSEPQGILDRIYKFWLELGLVLILGLDLRLGYPYRSTNTDVMTVPQRTAGTAMSCPYCIHCSVDCVSCSEASFFYRRWVAAVYRHTRLQPNTHAISINFWYKCFTTGFWLL